MAFPYDSDRAGAPLPRKDRASPDTTSGAYDVMAPRWQMLDAVLAGTEEMRAAGTLYLPVHPAESPVGYDNRRQRAILMNVLELTLDSLGGRPFTEKIKTSDVLPELEPLMIDMDTQGTTLDAFCRAWFREGLAKGFSHVMVDMPRLEQQPGQVRTLADDRAEARRPYCVRVCPENLIFARAEIVNGQEVLVHVRIRENEILPDGFGERCVERIRVLEPGRVEIWENQKRSPNAKAKWVLVDQYETSLPVIPLITFYATREALMLSKPPLLDLAFLNIAHWQSQSDQTNILTVTRFPMLACSGVSDEEGIIKIGPNQILTTADSQGKFYYVEHAGNAIAAGRDDLGELEKKMSAYGAQFLKEQPDRQAATSRILDSAETMSPLGAMTTNFAQDVGRMLDLMALWIGKPPGTIGGRVELDSAFDLDETTQWELQILQLTRQNRDISRKAFLEELIRRRVLSQEYDIELDETELTDEMSTGMMGAAAAVDLNPGAPEEKVGPEQS